MLFGDIDETSSEEVVKGLLALNEDDRKEPIYLLINSEGGDVHSTLAIHDTIKVISCPVIGVAMGKAMSGASLVHAACLKRLALPNTWFMLHSINFALPDLSRKSLQDQAQHSSMLCDQIYELYARYTKKTKDQIKSDLESGDILLNCQGAIEYGILDEIYSPVR